MDIPVRYLLEASERVLGEFQLDRLNKASNLKKEAREKTERAVETMAEALFAIWLREHKQELLEALASIPQERKEFPIQVE